MSLISRSFSAGTSFGSGNRRESQGGAIMMPNAFASPVPARLNRRAAERRHGIASRRWVVVSLGLSEVEPFGIAWTAQPPPLRDVPHAPALVTAKVDDQRREHRAVDVRALALFAHLRRGRLGGPLDLSHVRGDRDHGITAGLGQRPGLPTPLRVVPYSTGGGA